MSTLIGDKMALEKITNQCKNGGVETKEHLALRVFE
jgi:hypothetical protein